MELRAEWQWKRWDAVARLGTGKLTLQEAARVLRLSVRQVRRTGRSPAPSLTNWLARLTGRTPSRTKSLQGRCARTSRSCSNRC